MTMDLDTPSIMNEIKDLQQFFITALAQIEAGEVVSMTGVDKRISSVCRSAQNAPPEQQQIFLPELTILINLLNNYERDLRKLQSTLGADLPEGAGNGDSD
jgi:hypothetical protein